jgi:phosphatidylinositol alpha-1,6-mannosyltransferase
MLQILVLSSEFPPGPGGIGNHAFHLVQQLHGLGWKVRVVSPQDYASQAEIEHFNAHLPFSVETLSSGRGPLRETISRWRILAHQIRLHRPDLLLATGRSAVFLGALAKHLFGVRLVAVGHGTEFGARGFWNRNLVRWCYQQADAVIAVSQFTWELITKLGIRRRSGLVIQNGADHQRFDVLDDAAKDPYLRRLGLEESHILMTVGSVTERKGQEVVIRALPEILEEFPNTHYLMAGLPLEGPRLEALARSLGVKDHIHFLGRVSDPDLVGYLNCCDIFLMTSTFTRDGDCEGFGIAAVEAAMCGKPAIVTQGSGLSEAILDGKTGMAVPEGNPEAIAQAVLCLLRDPGLRQAMGAAAYSYSRTCQTWEQKGLEYDRFLRQLLAATVPLAS